MNKLAPTIGCLLMLGAAIAPGVMAHWDTGAHPLPYASVGVDATDGGLENVGDDGSGNILANLYAHYTLGPNDMPNPGAKGLAGWYYGSASLWLELDSTPPSVCPTTDPTVNALLCSPQQIVATAYALCDAEVVDNTGIADETQVEEKINLGSAQPDGLWNDGGIGAACHTPAGFYGDAADENGCAGDGTGIYAGVNAIAEDAVVGNDIWISTSCDYVTPTGNAGLLTQILSYSTCAPNGVLSNLGTPTNIPGAELACINTLAGCNVAIEPACAQTIIACNVTGVGCPAVGIVVCGADGNGDTGNAGTGDAHGDGLGVAYGTAVPACSGGVATSSEAVFVWNAVVLDATGTGGNLLSENSDVSLASNGWVSTP